MVPDGCVTEAALVLDCKGGGCVTAIPLDSRQEKFPSGKCEVHISLPLKGLRDFAVTVADNYLYVIGGYNTDERQCSEKVWR